MSFILACKELNGGIYITRLPKSRDDQTPGIPDNWYFVGPGLRPSIQEYNGTKFVLMFEYLSHLFCRIVDIATWPPTEVIPVTTPIPYPGGAWVITLSQDSLTLKTESNVSFGLTQEFFNPPILQQPLLFLDPNTATYSVTIQPVSSYFPQPPALITSPPASNTQVFYRFYARPFPYTGPWILITDWTLENYVFNVPTQPLFSFPFSNVGSLRYQFSVTWGGQFSPTDQWNPNAHMEGIPGQTFITVDSTTQHANAQATLFESLTLKESSVETFAIFSARQAFLVEAPSDSLLFSESLVEGGSTFVFFGTRQAFINESVADSLSWSVASAQGNTLRVVMG